VSQTDVGPGLSKDQGSCAHIKRLPPLAVLLPLIP
jgi:hypothetical protein